MNASASVTTEGARVSASIVDAPLYRHLFTPLVDAADRRAVLWLALSVLVCALHSVPVLLDAFRAHYVVQEDAIQHVFWMARFQDAELFPNDPIANYFESVAPLGYTSLYRAASLAGIHPLNFSRYLPPAIALISTVFLYRLALLLFPLPLAAFITTLLFNQNLWLKDDVASATPRAFVFPIFLAFLYFLLRRSQRGVVITVLLQGLFYPQLVLIMAGMLVLRAWEWQGARAVFARDPGLRRLCGFGLAASAAVLLPYALQSSAYGPTISAAEAKLLPEFEGTGESRFFYQDPLRFWLYGGRSGILPKEWWNPPVKPLHVFAGPWLLVVVAVPRLFPLARCVSAANLVLVQLPAASFGAFLAAHALLFTLHLPSRYTIYSLRIVLAIAAGIAIVAILDALLRWAETRGWPHPALARPLVYAVVGLMVVQGPLLPVLLDSADWRYPETRYRVGQEPRLYEFFAAQPKDILIASLDDEVNLLPSFARRSIITGSAYAIPYSLGYYSTFRQRTLELIVAHYSLGLTDIQGYIRRYGVDFVLVDDDAFSPDYLLDDGWIGQYAEAERARQALRRGEVPALSLLMQSCATLRTDDMAVLDVSCILGARAG